LPELPLTLSLECGDRGKTFEPKHFGFQRQFIPVGYDDGIFESDAIRLYVRIAIEHSLAFDLCTLSESRLHRRTRAAGGFKYEDYIFGRGRLANGTRVVFAQPGVLCGWFVTAGVQGAE